MAEDKTTALREAALHFHEFPKPGKLEIVATKPLANTRDLSPRLFARRRHSL